MFRIILSACLAALLATFSASPIGQRLERDAGLGLLYALRGEVEVHREAIVAALNADSIAWLQRNARTLAPVSSGLDGCLTDYSLEVMEQSRNVNSVPRALYVCLLRELTERSARYVVFDINFNADKPDDEALAEAIKTAGNVLLLERLSRGGVVRRLKPTGVFQNAAAGTVIFQADGAGDEVATGYSTFLPYAADALIMPIEVWRRYSGAASTKEAFEFELQPVWYYGKPETVRTHSIRDVFEVPSNNPLPDDLTDTVVFIGVSDSENPGAYDHFQMPSLFGRSDLIGGVEIAATAFLNLLHDERLKPLSRIGAWLTVFGVLFVMLTVGFFAAGMWGVLAVPATGAAYLAFAAIAFSAMQLWLPVAVPVMLGVPVVILAVLLLRYANAKEIVRRLAPRQIAEQLLRRSRVGRGESNIEQSTIMFIDLEGSTTLGERMDAAAYQIVMNGFYDAAERAIEDRDGMIVDFKGDGILALFNESVAGPDYAAKACQSALEVSVGVRNLRSDTDGEERPELKLRFGLHTGPVATGAIGSQQRYNFNALGDSVNTASRLEEYGKTFSGEKADVILVSGETFRLSKMPEAAVTLVGREKLRGKADEIDIYRLAQPLI